MNTPDPRREYFGTALNPCSFAQWLAAIDTDLESGKRLEIEALQGALSRYGKELGVPTPVNDFIYACLKPYANGQPER